MGTFQNDYTDNVKIYYRDLKKCEPIPFIRERELILKSKEGDVDARNKIIESNLRFVFNIARKYAGKGIPISDLISEGNLGLVKAIEKFDTTKDVKFITYAVYWIREYMSASIRKNYSRADLTLIEDLQDTAKKNDTKLLTKSKLYEIEDEDFDDGKDKIIDELLCVLNDKEKNIMEFTYGLGGQKPLTFQEIGKKYHISSERVRQIKIEALDKVRMVAMAEGKFRKA